MCFYLQSYAVVMQCLSLYQYKDITHTGIQNYTQGKLILFKYGLIGLNVCAGLDIVSFDPYIEL